MKKKNFIIALTLTLALGIGATAYADSNSKIMPNDTACTGYGMGKITGQRGIDFVTSVLKNKFGLKDADISNAKNSGKSMYDLAKEKGITADQLKAAMVEERTKAVDAAVKNGSISKEQGDALKAKIKDNSVNCQAPGQMRRMNGCGNACGQIR